MRGKLLYDGKPVYQFTDADWDLAVRAVEGEAGKNACSDSEGLAVMVCMINRWAMMLTLRWYQKLLLKQPEAKVYGFESFADMSDSYSQPVNPAWLDGDPRTSILVRCRRRRNGARSSCRAPSRSSPSPFASWSPGAWTGRPWPRACAGT